MQAFGKIGDTAVRRALVILVERLADLSVLDVQNGDPAVQS